MQQLHPPILLLWLNFQLIFQGCLRAVMILVGINHQILKIKDFLIIFFLTLALIFAQTLLLLFLSI